MSLKYKVVSVWVMCLSYKMVMTGCEVVLLNRNVTDSFRVGNDGCTNDTSVCTSSATCQSDGLCLCKPDRPSYRNPVLEVKERKTVYGNSYGCIDNDIFRFNVIEISSCVFRPFQVLPHSHKDPATTFLHTQQIFSCSLTKAQAKFPDNATEIELQWLNESYVDLNVSNNNLYFKWRKSVPNLQGTIITFTFGCMVPPSTNPELKAYQTKCLRAKVLGTWSPGTNPTVSNPVVTSKAPTTSALNSTGTMMTMSPTTSARSSSPGEVSSSDDDSSGTIIIIAVVVPVVLLIVLVVVVWCLCKRKKRYSQRNSSDERSSKKNGSARLKQFRHTDSNLRGPDAYEDGQARDTNDTFGAQANLGYSTPNSQRVIVEANPMYATPDIKRKEDKSANYNPPGYEPVNMKKRQGNEDSSQAEPGYATPDVNRREISRVNSYPEPGYETPDIKKKEINVATADSAYSTPEENNADIERIAVNGDLYALPDKNKSTKK
ncbi:Hypothetical predicted protein, partial [Paramuricea clavata]